MTIRCRLVMTVLCTFALFSSQGVAWAARSIATPQARPDAMFVGDAVTIVTVTASVASDPTLLPTSVNLIQLNADGSASAVIGRLYDDGTHGDVQAGDGNFTGQFSFSPIVVETLSFAATAAYRGTMLRTRSAPFNISFLRRPTDDEVQTTLQVQDEGTQYFENTRAQMGADQARAATVSFLLQQSGVTDAGIGSDSLTIWIEYDSGIEGLVSTFEPGTKGTTSGAAAREMGAILNQQARLNRVSIQSSISALASPEFPTTSRAIVLAPFFDEFSVKGGDAAPTIASDLSMITGDSSLLPILNDSVTVDVMKSLNQYGVIYISSHGNSGEHRGQVVIQTRESSRNIVLHLIDAVMHRVVMDHGRLAITGTFVSFYAGGGFPKSIVFVASCESVGTDLNPNLTMSDAFLGRGALSFLGYRNVVNTNFNFVTDTDFFRVLADSASTADQRTTGIAFNALRSNIDNFNNPNPDGTRGTLLLGGSHEAAIPTLPAVTLQPFGSHTIANAPGPYAIQVVDPVTLQTEAAPAQITVTLHRNVISQCGPGFSSNITAVIPMGGMTTTYGFVAGRDPNCPNFAITTRFTVTGAVMLPNIQLNLTAVPADQLVLEVIR